MRLLIMRIFCMGNKMLNATALILVLSLINPGLSISAAPYLIAKQGDNCLQVKTSFLSSQININLGHFNHAYKEAYINYISALTPMQEYVKKIRAIKSKQDIEEISIRLIEDLKKAKAIKAGKDQFGVYLANYASALIMIAWLEENKQTPFGITISEACVGIAERIELDFPEFLEFFKKNYIESKNPFCFLNMDMIKRRIKNFGKSYPPPSFVLFRSPEMTNSSLGKALQKVIDDLSRKTGNLLTPTDLNKLHLHVVGLVSSETFYDKEDQKTFSARVVKPQEIEQGAGEIKQQAQSALTLFKGKVNIHLLLSGDGAVIAATDSSNFRRWINKIRDAFSKTKNYPYNPPHFEIARVLTQEITTEQEQTIISILQKHNDKSTLHGVQLEIKQGKHGQFFGHFFADCPSDINPGELVQIITFMSSANIIKSSI